MSGFTTTGATIFEDIESLPHGILLWRSMTQWMGGMGIVLLGVAVLPLLGVGGMQLFKAEVPGPVKDRLSPRIQSTAKTLWVVYLALTVAETGLLILGGMSGFDALCHSFCTVSTGGFSTRNASIGAFDSSFIEGIVVVFMFLAGVNFSLHLLLARLRWKRVFTNEEFRLYAFFCVAAIAIIWLSLRFRTGEEAEIAMRHAVFQTVSIFTTTGFGTSDFVLWGFGTQVLLFMLMFMGACTGSTAGGMKLMRVIILAKHSLAMARKEIHPRAIFTIRYSGKVVSDDVMLKILGFFLFYMFVFFVVAAAVALMGVDVETSLGASIATLSNIGPGLGQVGPASNYAAVPLAAKVILAFSMLMGRLELYTVLVVMSPMFWRRT
jgi:trk system potassium uptake protein TrkH